MTEVRQIEVNSTSSNTADVSPIVLRDGQRKRLVFKPTIVNNPNDQDASVRGVLVYQARRQADQWVDVESIPLNTVKSGENIRFELSSGEILKLFQYLSALYEYMRANGIEFGTTHLLPIDNSPGASEVLTSIAHFPDQAALKGVLEWLQGRNIATVADALEDSSGELVSHLSVATGLARIKSFIREAEANLDSSDESTWQAILARNSWALGQIYANPVVILKAQAYLGGKAVDNKGGNVADFLYRNQITDNVLIIEIKTPVTALTTRQEYRNNAFACSKELAGAVQQVIQDLHTLRENFASLQGDEGPAFRIFNPRLLLIAGNIGTEANIHRRRSFELFRGNLKNIEIITFDELIAKARLLLELFSQSE